ncbi:MAG: PD40 domain-containing protein [Phycisphaerales bacterium]|nr:PD40 domain-containing protein [Phycisphaerales bacterium]
MVAGLVGGLVLSASVMGLADGPRGRDAGEEHLRPPAPTPAAGSERAVDWRAAESGVLEGHVQVTLRERFVKAGEAYFDHQSPPQWIVFQAVPVPVEGAEPDSFYSMYVAPLVRDGEGNITGTGDPVRISPEGSANTCGWFHPTRGEVLFGSTLTRPSDQQKSGFQVGARKYVWMFPAEMEIVRVRQAAAEKVERTGTKEDASIEVLLCTGFKVAPLRFGAPEVLISRPQYDAECSYSADGRYVLYAHVREAKDEHDRPDADLFVYDTLREVHVPLVEASGYDGGPFFSPDGKWICYRSDRRGDDLLQLFIAELKFNEAGAITGIERELQITDNSAVNWAPYWHPSGKFLVYGSSEMGHQNYEVFAVEVDPAVKNAAELRRARVTQSGGADVLPVFSDDGSLMMWTAQRNTDEGARPSSQVWIARAVPGGIENLIGQETKTDVPAPDAAR